MKFLERAQQCVCLARYFFGYFRFNRCPQWVLVTESRLELARVVETVRRATGPNHLTPHDPDQLYLQSIRALEDAQLLLTSSYHEFIGKTAGSLI